MSDPVHGQYCVLSMRVGITNYPVLCGTDTTYACNAEMIERTGPESGGARQWMRRIEEHVSTVSGLTKVSNDASLTFFYMLQTAIRRELQFFIQTFADHDGNSYSISGNALIASQNINGPASDFSSAQIEIRWDGTPTLAIIAPPPSGTESDVQEPLYIPVVDGEVSVQDNHLIGATILQVRRNGRSQVPTTGTPGNDEYKFDSVTGRVYTDATVPYVSGEQPIYVLYKI